MTTPATAETVARHLEQIHAHLVALHANAEDAGLPQGIVASIHWLVEDAANTIAHLRETIAKPMRGDA